MKPFRIARARRVQTEADRRLALAVLAETYQREKGWVLDAASVFPAEDMARSDISWFLSTERGRPVGVMRVLYDPPIQHYAAYDLKMLDPALPLDALAEARFAEIGRFAVAPDRRKSVAISLGLIAAATKEVVARGYDQLITDVFENEPNSPLGFHTRIIGFKPVATHEIGELRHEGRRITLLLDIKSAYLRLKASGNLFFRVLTRGWTKRLHLRLAA